MSEAICTACSHLYAPGQRGGIAVWDPQRQAHYCDKCGAFVDVDADDASPDDQERAARCAQIEKAQGVIGSMQMQYRADRGEFWALGVAFEAVRFAWYVVSGDNDTAREKLGRVRGAIADFEQFEKKRAEEQNRAA